MDNSLHLMGPQAKKLMAKHKHGATVKLSIRGRITSMESRDCMDYIMSNDSPKRPKKPKEPEHHVNIEVEEVESDSEK